MRTKGGKGVTWGVVPNRPRKHTTRDTTRSAQCTHTRRPHATTLANMCNIHVYIRINVYNACVYLIYPYNHIPTYSCIHVCVY